MSPRVGIITELIAPYRLPVFNKLAANASVEPHIIFLSETDPSLREWHIYRDEIRFRYNVLPNWRRWIGSYSLLVNWGLSDLLDRTSPELLICGGYNYLASWEAAHWCRQRGVPLVLWSESTAFDQRREYPVVEFLKRKFLQQCQAFVVPGRSAFKYLESLGVRKEAIVTAPNAIDNEFFAQSALMARANATHYRSRYGLPERFFLYCGRLTQLKGVFDLLDAYASLPPDIRSQVSLVFAGSGDAKPALQQRAERIYPGRVHFPGFVHREDLPAYYALADMLMFPTHSDTWGLVVNEAMACGLPVVSSSVAGCAADLVVSGQTGLLVDAGSVDQLASAMKLLSRNPEMGNRFAANSLRKIENYSPQRCAEGLLAVVDLLMGRTVNA